MIDASEIAFAFVWQVTFCGAGMGFGEGGELVVALCSSRAARWIRVWRSPMIWRVSSSRCA